MNPLNFTLSDITDETSGLRFSLTDHLQCNVRATGTWAVLDSRAMDHLIEALQEMRKAMP